MSCSSKRSSPQLPFDGAPAFTRLPSRLKRSPGANIHDDKWARVLDETRCGVFGVEPGRCDHRAEAAQDIVPVEWGPGPGTGSRRVQHLLTSIDLI